MAGMGPGSSRNTGKVWWEIYSRMETINRDLLCGAGPEGVGGYPGRQAKRITP